jgi:hypothetical protein
MIDNMAHFFGTNVLAKIHKISSLKTRKEYSIENYPFGPFGKIFAKFSKNIEKLEYICTF